MAERERLLSAVRESVEAYCAAEHDFAFDPGNPVVRLHEPTFGPDEIMAAMECLLTTRVTLGPKVKAFERQFADSLRLGHGVMNNSGSSANLLAVAALASDATSDGLKPGDEVVVPALSWSTTVWPLIQHGLVPVVVDVDPATLNIDPAALEDAIGPKTRALMIVHVYGNPCDMDAILNICRARDLILIEDCCEALGAVYDGKPVGGFGRVGTFSFYFSHHITTLEGGISVTADGELADAMRILRAHGWVREAEDPDRYTSAHPDIDPKFLFVDLGYNLRPTEVQGAMGSVQLAKLAGFVDHRRECAAAMTATLGRYGEVLQLQQETAKGKHSWFGLPITLAADAPFTLAELRGHLERAGVETRPLICGNIARQPALRGRAHRVAGELVHADAVMERGFAIANHQAVDAAARDYMASQFEAFMTARGIG